MPARAPAQPLVSVVIVSYNTRDLTLAAVGSVYAHCDVPFDVWVVDNGSADGTVAALRERYPGVHVIALDENVGFGRGNNVAMERARGSFFLLLNSDARLVRRGDVSALVARARVHGRIGVVGPRLVSEEGAIEYSARRFPSVTGEFLRRFGLHRLFPRRWVAGRLLGSFWPHDAVRDVDWLTGACLVVRREVYEQVGGFDPRIFMYGEEQEWCHRVRAAGWRIVFDPGVTVVHRRAASSGAGAGAAWRVRAALAADLELLRRTRGRGYAAAFALVRLVGLAFEWAVYGLAQRVGGSAYYGARSAGARLELREHGRLVAGVRA